MLVWFLAYVNNHKSIVNATMNSRTAEHRAQPFRLPFACFWQLADFNPFTRNYRICAVSGLWFFDRSNEFHFSSIFIHTRDEMRVYAYTSPCVWSQSGTTNICLRRYYQVQCSAYEKWVKPICMYSFLSHFRNHFMQHTRVFLSWFNPLACVSVGMNVKFTI